MTSLTRTRSAVLLALAAATWLTPSAPAQAADPAAARPVLLPRPAALSASAAKAPAAPAAPAAATAAKDGTSAAGKPRSPGRNRTRALGGDDDLKDLEVERARGKNR